MKKILIIICIVLVLSISVLAAQTVANENVEQSTLSVKTSDNQKTSTSVELAFSSLGLKETAGLRQFGYDMLNSLIPSCSSLVNDDYLLGPGDELRIYLWGDSVDLGAIQSYYEVSIDLDGGLFMAPVGRMSVYGRTIKEIEDILSEKLNYKYNNISVEVAPAKIRDFPIYISGFVNNPGVVTVNGLWTVADTLGLSGGVLPEGSLRNIQVQRNGKTLKVDLYNLFLKGQPVSLTMQEGDVIYVPPITKVCAITGLVKRAGIYEMGIGETVKDLLSYAGGLQLSGTAFTARLVRQDGTKVTVREVSTNINDITNRIMQDGDLLLLTPSNAYLSNVVKVTGAINYPGIYDIKTSPTLSELIKRVELRYDADLAFGTIFRDNVHNNDAGVVFSPKAIVEGTKDVELFPNDVVQFYTVEHNFTQEPIRITGLVENPGVVVYEKGMRLLDAIKNTEFSTEISSIQIRLIRDNKVQNKVYLRDLLIKGDRDQNVLIKSGDMIVAVQNEDAENQEGVKVLGQVNNPGVYTYKTELHLSDVLVAAGGYSEQAYPQALYLIRESVKTKQLKQINKTISITRKELDALEASVAVKNDLSDREKNLIAVQIENQRSLLESASQNQGDMLGRIALTIPAKLGDLKGSPDDILLSQGDYIYVPERTEYVTVVGDIDSTIALPWEKSKKVKDYLFDLGGLRSKDYIISIIKYNGKVVKEDNLFFGWSTIENQILEPDDVIIAVKKISVPAGTQLIEGLSEVTDSVYKIVYSLNALDFF